MSSSRILCPRCQQWTSTQEKTCSFCKTKFPNELAWKIPLIIGLFLLSLIASIVFALLEN